MNIKDIVDCEKYFYVQPYDQTVKTGIGSFVIPRGFLSDGASGVIDLCKKAHFSHDYLYLIPEIDGKRISKRRADRIYGRILWQNHHVFTGLWRPWGLFFFGGKAFRSYRKLDRERPDHVQDHFVPDASYWKFHSYATEDAEWVGPVEHEINS